MPRTRTDGEPGTELKSIGSKVPKADYDRLRWLAYTRDSDVSKIVAGYVARCLADEDFTGYSPPQREE